MLNKLNELNSFKIYDVSDNKFLEFGRVLKNYDLSECDKYLNEKTEIPKEANTYIADDESFHAMPIFEQIKNNIYGEMDIQFGYCNGNNFKLGALEYHKCSEVNYAATDLVLMLSNYNSIRNLELNSSDVSVFFIRKGISIELFANTLHFAPCKVSDYGFKCLVVLTKGTNTPLENKKDSEDLESKMLFMKNKWLIAHPEREDFQAKGVCMGIKGENLVLKYK